MSVENEQPGSVSESEELEMPPGWDGGAGAVAAVEEDEDTEQEGEQPEGGTENATANVVPRNDAAEEDGDVDLNDDDPEDGDVEMNGDAGDANTEQARRIEGSEAPAKKPAADTSMQSSADGKKVEESAVGGIPSARDGVDKKRVAEAQPEGVAEKMPT
ncbi:unnamed protein product, partial [Amoebophrya sp. A25]|eukprot:GSA25T00021625001.1